MNEMNHHIAEGIIKNLPDIIPKNDIKFLSARRIATWAMPNINYAFQEMKSGKTIAILFFNEHSGMNEIKSNAVASLNNFDSSIIAFESRQLKSADAFVLMLKAEHLESLPIGVIAYDLNGNINILQPLLFPNTMAVARTVKEQKSYWCWWRDASQYEVASLLELSAKYDDKDEDIYSKYVYPEFFDLMLSGKTLKWDGSPRAKTYSESSYKAEKQNYKIPLCQLGLLEPTYGKITPKGRSLLSIIMKYGADSAEYFNSLAKLILVDGKHLDLIKDLDEFQKNNSELIPQTSAEFFILFDSYMMNRNSMGTRKPSAVTTGAKKAYVRDEPKLWNKLGLIKMVGRTKYYQAFEGISFNWDRINQILLSNYLGESNE